MKFTIINTPDSEDIIRWHEFIENHPNGNPFQTPWIVDFYRSIPGYQPISIILKDIKNEIQGVLVAVIQNESGLIKSRFSKRAVIYGGPLVMEYQPIYMDALLAELIHLTSHAIYIEFRNLFDLSLYSSCFIKAGFIYKEHFNYHVPIISLEENKKILSKSKLRQITSSIKAGTVILLADSSDEVKELYNLLLKLYKTKVKKPLPPIQFFLQFYNRPELGVILVIKNNNRIIGGMICPIFAKKTIYEWYVCGMDGKEKNIFPSVLITWAAIQFGIDERIELFDFMGAGTPDDSYGVREFKSKFGGNLVCFGRFHRINNRLLHLIGKVAIKAIGKYINL